jgi:hypothetical protein
VIRHTKHHAAFCLPKYGVPLYESYIHFALHYSSVHVFGTDCFYWFLGNVRPILQYSLQGPEVWRLLIINQKQRTRKSLLQTTFPEFWCSNWGKPRWTSVTIAHLQIKMRGREHSNMKPKRIDHEWKQSMVAVWVLPSIIRIPFTVKLYIWDLH